MTRIGVLARTVVVLVPILPLAAQQSTGKTSTIVPSLVRFNGILTDGKSKPFTGVVGVTFYLYKDSQGGAPLWMETQNVQPDKTGHYTVMLGTASGQGLPAELFASGEARWLAVQVQGKVEQPRVLLLSVPYALKSEDAQTLGGLPASAFVRTAPDGRAGKPETKINASPSASSVSASASPITGPGTQNFIPLWITSTKLGNSRLFQSGSSVLFQSGTRVGLGTTTPGATLDLFSTGTIGLRSRTNAGATNSTAALGTATSPTGSTIGMWGVSQSTGGFGVVGQATAASGNTVGVEGVSASTTGVGVLGQASATSGNTVAVQGTTASPTGIGIKGVATDTTCNGIGQCSFGVEGIGQNSFGAGVVGVNVAPSKLGKSSFPNAGVWGDAGAPGGTGIAVLATADDTNALAATNNGTSITAILTNRETFQNGVVVLQVNGGAGGMCTINVNGHLSCNGALSIVANGSAGHQTELYSVAAAESLFEDVGSGRLSNGATLIRLDPRFVETVNTGISYHVFLTPEGDCNGLYVSNESASSFEVHELGKGTSNVAFNYRIVAKRKGFEDLRLADMTTLQTTRAVSQKKHCPDYFIASLECGMKNGLVPSGKHAALDRPHETLVCAKKNGRPSAAHYKLGN